MKQAMALSILQTGANVFLTGEPGSGKTHTINAYVEWLRERGVEPAITASTGIAATHVGGMTIHAWSGIGVKRDLTEYDIDELASRERLVRRAAGARVLVIDEISMIDARTLSMAERAIRAVKRSERPWGGMQVVFVGDFFQLPPVSKDVASDPSIDFETRETVGKQHPRFAFASPAWEAANPLVCYLSEQHRQGDGPFLELLGAVRKGKIDDGHHELLGSRSCRLEDLSEKVARLYSHNANVDRENAMRLDAIDGKAYTYPMTSKGPATLVESLKRGCLSPETLVLKEGARVMFTKNSPDGAYANGTLGVVAGFGETGPIVKTNDGRSMEVQGAEWSIAEGGAVRARIVQIPLRLAWAITVHKSQGLTLDAAAVDLSGAFEYGQGYVALSRVRALSGLYVLGYNERSLLVHPEIRERDTAFKWASADARERFEGASGQDIKRLSDAFVRAIGGKPEGGARRVRKEKVDTYKATLALAKEGRTIEDIAKTRSLKAGTIVSHLEKLKENGELAPAQIAALVPADQAKRLAPIQKEFKKKKSRALTPMFKALKGAYSFEDIRLARLLFDE